MTAVRRHPQGMAQRAAGAQPQIQRHGADDAGAARRSRHAGHAVRTCQVLHCGRRGTYGSVWHAIASSRRFGRQIAAETKPGWIGTTLVGSVGRQSAIPSALLSRPTAAKTGGIRSIGSQNLVQPSKLVSPRPALVSRSGLGTGRAALRPTRCLFEKFGDVVG